MALVASRIKEALIAGVNQNINITEWIGASL